MEQYRIFLAKQLEACGYCSIYSESQDFAFIPHATAIETCLANVKRSHILLLLLGDSYGTIGDNGKSIVENEFEIAKENKLVIIPFVQKNTICDFWSWKSGDKSERSNDLLLQYGFIERIKIPYFYTSYDSPIELVNLVKGKLNNTFCDFLERAKNKCITNSSNSFFVEISTRNSIFSYLVDLITEKFTSINDIHSRNHMKLERSIVCNRLLDIEPIYNGCFQYMKSLSDQISGVINLINDGISLKIPQKFDEAVNLFCAQYVELLTWHNGLLNIETNKEFKSVFVAMAKTFEQPLLDYQNFPLLLYSCYTKACRKLEENPEIPQQMNICFTLNGPQTQPFTREIALLANKCKNPWFLASVL